MKKKNTENAHANNSATMKSFENEKNTEVESDCRYFD